MISITEGGTKVQSQAAASHIGSKPPRVPSHSRGTGESVVTVCGGSQGRHVGLAQDLGSNSSRRRLATDGVVRVLFWANYDLTAAKLEELETRSAQLDASPQAAV